MERKPSIYVVSTTYDPTVAKYGMAKQTYNTKTGTWSNIQSQGAKTFTIGGSTPTMGEAMASNANRAGAKVYDKSTGKVRDYQASDFVQVGRRIVGQQSAAPLFDPNTGGVKLESWQVRTTQDGKYDTSLEGKYDPVTGKWYAQQMSSDSNVWGQKLSPRRVTENVLASTPTTQPTYAQTQTTTETPYIAPFFGINPIATTKGGMRFFGSASYKR